MVKNKNFFGTMVTNPYFFRHFDLSNFAVYVNEKQITSDGFSLDTRHNKTTLMLIERYLRGQEYITPTQDFR
jgi:hypothetical protein